MAGALRKVELFLGPMACSCSGMPSPAKLEKIDKALRLRRFLEKERQNTFQVNAWDLGDESMYEDGLRLLRDYLRDGGVGDLADRLAFAVNDATPSVAVDGKLEWIHDCPEIPEFLERFETVKVNQTSQRAKG